MGIAPDAVASYVDRAVEAMADIVGDLGDDLANARPGLPAANSPYAILRHCLGVMEEVCQHLGRWRSPVTCCASVRWARPRPSQGAGHPADGLGDQRR